MSDESAAQPSPPEWRVVRANDYYGGDLFVGVEQHPSWGSTGVVLTWRAWGGYGGVTIAIADATEARELARALLDMADTIAPPTPPRPP